MFIVALESGVAQGMQLVSLTFLHSVFAEIPAGHHIERNSVTDWTLWEEKGNVEWQAQRIDYWNNSCASLLILLF